MEHPMRLFTKIAAGTLLTIGIPIVVLTTLEITNLEQPPEDREAALAALIFLGLPPTLLGSWLIFNGVRHDRQKERDRLRQVFYNLLQESNGEITTMQFAIASGLTGDCAKQYLDERAKEFNAAYDVLEEGSISYQFRLKGD
jgi:hypothetical protein